MTRTSAKLRFGALGSLALLLLHCSTSSGDDGPVSRAGSGGTNSAAGSTATAGQPATAGLAAGGNAGLGAGGASSATGGSEAAGDPNEAGAGGQSNPARPANVVFVLTDDLSWNLVEYMPAVKQMMTEGASFARYFVTDSLCCPSRSTIFTGKFPHNTGVFTNDAPNGGYTGFLKRNNQKSTFATALSAAGYATAMMGKYMNLYKVDMPADPGWTHWAVADAGYKEYDYDLRIDDTKQHYGDTPADYGVDVLSGLGQKFVAASAQTPFLLEIATFAPHGPYTPAPRYEQAFPELAGDAQHPAVPPAAFPKTPAWAARPTADAPEWQQALPALTPAEKLREFNIFRLRAQSVQAVDEMLATLRAQLKASGLDQNTYVVFSSDNGFHLGEHSMFSGKQTAYDHDIRVPLVVVGPGVPAGVTIDAIAQNTDLCPTFVDIAGLPAEPARDGRSLLPWLRGETIDDWREFAVIEHRNPGFNPDDPDSEPGAHANPPSYEAIATGDETYIEYATGEREYFNHASDPHELENAFPALGAPQRTRFKNALAAAKSCQGAEGCAEAQRFK